MFTRAIVAALKAQWPEHKVYVDDVKQYLTPPCFVIRQADTAYQLLFGENRSVRCSYAIYYYPLDNAKREELQQMGLALCQVLELLWHEGLGYWASGMQHRIVEHALLLTLSYTYRYRTIEEPELMETLQHTVSMGDDKNGK